MNETGSRLPSPRIFQGSLAYYLAKYLMALLGLFFVLVAVFVLGGLIYAMLREGVFNITSLSLLLILSFGVVNAILFTTIVLAMYPEIGVSDEGLWFRQLFGWTTIPWAAIEHTSDAKTLFVKQGILIYSAALPFYCWYFGIAYGRRFAKALFIPAQLNGLDDLIVELRNRLVHH